MPDQNTPSPGQTKSNAAAQHVPGQPINPASVSSTQNALDIFLQVMQQSLPAQLQGMTEQLHAVMQQTAQQAAQQTAQRAALTASTKHNALQLGQFLAARRQALHVQPEWVATFCDCDPALLQALEQGDAHVPLELLLRIIEALGLQLSLFPKE